MAQPVTPVVLRQQAAPGTIDPNVKVPRAVVEAGQRSEAIQRAVNGEAEPSVIPPDGETQPPPNGQDVQPEQPRGPVDWERQFKSLSGRVEAENKKMREEVARMSEQMQRTQQENAILRGQSAPPPQPQAQQYLTEQEVADYGPDFVDVMRRVVAEATTPLNEEINRLRYGLGSVQAEAGNTFLSRMNSTIGSVIPNWEKLNKDPGFVAWSQLPDVFSGAIRKGLMQEAWNSGDAQRVAAFFKAYLAEVAATDPQRANGQHRPAPRTVVSEQSFLPPVSPAGVSLTDLAAPGRAQSPGGQPGEKPVYTAAEITRFYTDVAAGRWRGRDQQRVAIDADIILAQHEGRIIPDQRTQLPKDPYAR